jgi:hypothetical protein
MTNIIPEQRFHEFSQYHESERYLKFAQYLCDLHVSGCNPAHILYEAYCFDLVPDQYFGSPDPYLSYDFAYCLVGIWVSRDLENQYGADWHSWQSYASRKKL